MYEDVEQMRAAFADEIDVNIYSRFSNPNVKEFVDRVCLLEGAEAGYATSSGMSAIFASSMSASTWVVPVLEMTASGPVVVSPAPTTFQGKNS